MSHDDLADNALNEVALFKGLLSEMNVSLKCAWDIGGNMGLYALALREQFPGIRIHTFEPVEENLRFLRQNILMNNADQAIIVHPAGIGEVDERIPMGLPKHRESENTGLYSRFYGDLDFGKEIVGDCQIVSGETALQMCAEPPDIVKIDVEGAELSVLTALTPVISETRAVIVEVAEDPRFPHPSKVNEWLLAAGFLPVYPGLDFVPSRGKRGRKAYNRLWTRRSVEQQA
jgi:FkbM family methyltransferase